MISMIANRGRLRSEPGFRIQLASQIKPDNFYVMLTLRSPDRAMKTPGKNV